MPHLASRLFGAPLLIADAKLGDIRTWLEPRLLGRERPDADNTLVPAGRPAIAIIDGIAIVPVLGTLVQRSFGLMAASGLTSYDQVAADVEAAISDPSIRAVLLEIDSSGGEAAGCFAAAERLIQLRGRKPIWAIANERALSAGYALACCADRVVLPEAACAGSIGVVAVHVDRSAADAEDGLRFTLIHAGAHKADGDPHQPLSPQVRDDIQTEIDRKWAMFCRHVAAARGLTEARIRATEAAVLWGGAAVDAGLADAIAGRASALAMLADAARRRSVSPPANRSLAVRGVTIMSESNGPAAEPAATSMQLTPEPPISAPPVSGQPVSERAGPELPVLEAAALASPGADALARAEQTGYARGLQAGEAAMLMRARTVHELAVLAGSPERTMPLFLAGKSVDEARKELVDARASAAPVLDTRIPTALGGTGESPLIAHIKRANAPAKTEA